MARTAAQLKSLGVPTWDHGHAQYFVRLWENLDWPDAAIDAAIKSYVSYKGNDPDELIQRVREAADYADAPNLDRGVNEARGVVHLIATDQLPDVDFSQPAFSADERAQIADRIAEMRQMSRDNPDAFNASKELQAEYLELLEAQGAGGDGKVQEGVNPPAPPPSGDRLAEIRNIARNDPDSFERNLLLQQEQQALIAASLPPPAASAVAPSPTNPGDTQ